MGNDRRDAPRWNQGATMIQFPKTPPRPRDTQPVELTEADIEAYFSSEDPSERITIEFDCIAYFAKVNETP
jgi:hypothetical protein